MTLSSERRTLFLLGAVQFVNILDFMMVMPLGPDFAAALGISPDRLGIVGGSYTAAAAVAGLVGSRFLDRFERRAALGVAMLGLVVATALGGLATGLGTLMAARMLAGAFGGPATSLSLSIIADIVPPERRGKALGAVMGAFSVASVLGVPIGLELSRLGSWRAPFFSVAALGLLVVVAAVRVLPLLRGHMESANDAPAGALPPWRRGAVLLAWCTTSSVMIGNFALIPFISPYLQYNLGYPRDRLGLLYMAGGAGSFAMMRLAGEVTDRFGEVAIGVVATALVVGVVWGGFVAPLPGLPVMALFVGFMLAMSARNVAVNTLHSKVPEPWERARFLSIQSAVQHVAAAVGAFVASQLVRSPSQTAPLIGIPRVAGLAVALALLVPWLMWGTKARLGKRVNPTAV